MCIQLEFDFTFSCFCDWVDDDTGNVVGGCVEECFYDCKTQHYYPTEDVIAFYGNCDYFPVCKFEVL